MPQALQTLIQQACEDSGEVDFRNDYSGRCMYGRRCVGIVSTQQECMRLIAEVIKQAHAASVEGDEIDWEQAVDQLMSFSQDSMGMGSIIYWEQLEPIEGFRESGYEPPEDM